MAIETVNDLGLSEKRMEFNEGLFNEEGNVAEQMEQNPNRSEYTHAAQMEKPLYHITMEFDARGRLAVFKNFVKKADRAFVPFSVESLSYYIDPKEFGVIFNAGELAVFVERLIPIYREELTVVNAALIRVRRTNLAEAAMTKLIDLAQSDSPDILEMVDILYDVSKFDETDKKYFDLAVLHAKYLNKALELGISSETANTIRSLIIPDAFAQMGDGATEDAIHKVLTDGVNPLAAKSLIEEAAVTAAAKPDGWDEFNSWNDPEQVIVYFNNLLGMIRDEAGEEALPKNLLNGGRPITEFDLHSNGKFLIDPDGKIVKVDTGEGKVKAKFSMKGGEYEGNEATDSNIRRIEAHLLEIAARYEIDVDGPGGVSGEVAATAPAAGTAPAAPTLIGDLDGVVAEINRQLKEVNVKNTRTDNRLNLIKLADDKKTVLDTSNNDKVDLDYPTEAGGKKIVEATLAKLQAYIFWMLSQGEHQATLIEVESLVLGVIAVTPEEKELESHLVPFDFKQTGLNPDQITAIEARVKFAHDNEVSEVKIIGVADGDTPDRKYSNARADAGDKHFGEFWLEAYPNEAMPTLNLYTLVGPKNNGIRGIRFEFSPKPVIVQNVNDFVMTEFRTYLLDKSEAKAGAAIERLTLLTQGNVGQFRSLATQLSTLLKVKFGNDDILAKRLDDRVAGMAAAAPAAFSIPATYNASNPVTLDAATKNTIVIPYTGAAPEGLKVKPDWKGADLPVTTADSNLTINVSSFASAITTKAKHFPIKIILFDGTEIELENLHIKK